MQPTQELFGVKIHNLTMNDVVSEVERFVQEKKNAVVCTTNVDFIIRAQEDAIFRDLINNAELNTVDSQPLIFASKLLKKPLVEKVSGSDLLPEVCSMAAEKGYSVFFLGAAPGVADRAAENLCKKYTSLNVAGTYSPPFHFENDPAENQKAVDIVNKAKPDILFVALGSPKQELWIHQNKGKISPNVSLGVGATFDFLAGNISRAPKFIQSLGFEWLYRLVCEPKRLWKRYLVEDSKFINLFFKEFFK